ncbi:MAG: FG-GAP-like repeat-containing protein, partial [Chlorobium sp.]
MSTYTKTDTNESNNLIIYSNDFDGNEIFGIGINGGLSGLISLENVQGFTENGFAGNFLRNSSTGNPASKTTLTLTNLPVHNVVDVNFLLALIDSWDSTNGLGGYCPDYFNVSVDGVSVLQLTSANGSGNITYSGNQLGSLFNRGFSAFTGGGYSCADRAFDMSSEPFLTIPHTATTLTIQFFASGSGWEGGGNESWAIENLQVTLDAVLDTTVPTIISATPADDTMSVSVGSDIVLTFSDAVQAGSGNIVITDGADVRTISVIDSTQVTFDGSTITINPTDDLHAGSSYHVEIDNGAIKDLADNSFAGINDATTLDFATTNATPRISIPAIFSLSPVADHYTISGYPTYFTTTDVNSDNKTDLVTLDDWNHTISLWFNNGDGMFALNAIYPTNDIYRLISADLNGDDKDDLILSSANTISVWMNNGEGTFTTKDYIINEARWSYDVNCIDVNNDGKLDLVIPFTDRGFSYKIAVFLNNNDGTFDFGSPNSQILYTIDSINDFRSEINTDINGDGKADLIVACSLYTRFQDNSLHESAIVSVLINNGNGSFSQVNIWDLDSASGWVMSLKSGDVDGDGKTDLIGSTMYGLLGSSLIVWLNNGDGTFTTTTVENMPVIDDIVDLNGDGKSDLLSGSMVYINNGDGTFSLPIDLGDFLSIGHLYFSYVSQVAAVDVNSDSRYDIVATNYELFPGVSVYFNSSPSVLTHFTEQTPVVICSDI